MIQFAGTVIFPSMIMLKSVFLKFDLPDFCFYDTKCLRLCCFLLFSTFCVSFLFLFSSIYYCLLPYLQGFHSIVCILPMVVCATDFHYCDFCCSGQTIYFPCISHSISLSLEISDELLCL